jgi:glycerophosphoryl diester phosphodiesterase
VLNEVGGRVPVLIEIKTGSPLSRLGPALAKVLNDYQGEVALQSFDPRILHSFRKLLPKIPRGQICGTLDSGQVSPLQRALLRAMVLNTISRPNFLAFDVNAMPDPFVAFWRRVLRIPLLLWTVKTKEQSEVAARYQANLIFEAIRPS